MGRFGRFGPSGSGWLVPRGSKSGLSAPNSTVLWSGNGGFWPIPRIPNYRRPPTYSPILMYLGIQILAGFPQLEIASFASFANTFRRFGVPGNPGSARLRGARNRDFREEIPPFWGAGESNFWRLP